MSFLDRWFRRAKPYKVMLHSLSREEITGRCRAVAHSYKEQGVATPFAVYRQIVDALVVTPGFDVRPMSQLMAPVDEEKVVISLRHDLDGDIVTGVRAARYLARKGLPGSFYLLHTSHYYGVVENNVFHRFAGLESFVAELIATGCELGLHCDPLYLYCVHNINGAEAVRSEIAWLGSLGVKVSGTVAHNSAIVFGAENFEVFQNKSIGGRRSFTYKGKNFPLHVLDEAKLGLTYEGNYPVLPESLDSDKVAEYLRLSTSDCVRNMEWLRYYFLDNPFFGRGYDVDIWLLGCDAWVIAKRGKGAEVLWPVKTKDVLAYLEQLGGGVRVVICVHPEYISGD
ncbi:hypothetical protein FEF65_00630 [Mariprofundus erugo]|uniref:Polysaccharide deacetylase n=1 Tax=Mariprofundus erugo TaxID=2528639 RepID=A0A5R9GVU6_9PROT|nr:hypothetical protein [Mariprofundus erugo]TLS69035.1 hypothetical protein FEF65_00630 [Mariprofundus erugo]